MENICPLKNIPEPVRWLVDDLRVIPTTKIYTPNYNMDYTKVVIGIEQLAEYILGKTKIKIDTSQKEELVNKLCDKLYPLFEQDQINIIGKTLQEVLIFN